MTKSFQPQIFMVPKSQVRYGTCDVCGRSADLIMRDSATGHEIGACCRRDLFLAERELSRAGVRHPTLNESNTTGFNR